MPVIIASSVKEAKALINCGEGNYLILPGTRGIKRKQLGLHEVKDKPQNKAI